MSDHPANPAEAHPDSVQHPHAAHPHARQPVLDASLNMQIAQLQKSVDTLSNKVAIIQKEVAPQTIERTGPRSKKEVQDAKWAAAGVSALVVGKIATIPGGIVGLYTAAKDLVPAGQRNPWTLVKALVTKKSGSSILNDTTKWGGITLAGGMVVGGILGYIRGDRLEHPKMLWKEPVHSLKVLLGFAEGYKEPVARDGHQHTLTEDSASVALKTPTSIVPDLTQGLPAAGDGEWQNREAARRESAAHGAEASLSH